ncbi:hypothetical protein LCGC14_2067900 [marine sediment metagenome]|uniref:DUF1570 domain-containing protein n=1 Tax=marine sediment metagenome TaxID=412755 RepID=A0A0F9EJ65_9ZZZZ
MKRKKACPAADAAKSTGRPSAAVPCISYRRVLQGLLGLSMLAVMGCQGDLSPAMPLVTSIQRSEWAFGDVPGSLLATDHYRIRTTSGNRAMLTHLPAFMEAAYSQYLSLTGLVDRPGGRPMPIYLLASRPQWAAMTRSVTGDQSATYLAIENGGYCYRGVCVLWDMRNFATFSIAAHEGLHQLLYHRLREHVPAWAEEGLCVQAEGFAMSATTVRLDPRLNTLRMANLRKVLSAGRWLALAKLLASDAADHIKAFPMRAPEYYGQLWALVMFIRSDPNYRAGLERMIADAQAGKFRKALGVPPIMGRGRSYNRAVSVPAFRHYIEADLATFEKRFKAYAKKLAKLS